VLLEKAILKRKRKTMNISRKILIPVFVLVLVVPQVVSVVWWNPLSWFEPKSEEAEIIKSDQMSEDKSLVDDSPEPSIQDDVIEKVVEKVITVDNPELQKQVNALIAENASLKRQIVSLTEQIKTLSNQQQKEPEKETPKTYQSEVKPLVDRLEANKKMIEDLEQLKLDYCYKKTSSTSNTTAFSSSTAISNNTTNFPDGFPLPASYGDVKWISCGDINGEIIPSLNTEQKEINENIDLLKLRYGI